MRSGPQALIYLCRVEAVFSLRLPRLGQEKRDNTADKSSTLDCLQKK